MRGAIMEDPAPLGIGLKQERREREHREEIKNLLGGRGIILQGSMLWHKDPYVLSLSLSGEFVCYLWVMGERGGLRGVIRAITYTHSAGNGPRRRSIPPFYLHTPPPANWPDLPHLSFETMFLKQL